MISILALYLAMAAIGGVIVAEASLHLRRLPLRHQEEFAAIVRDRYQAELQEVSITAADSIVLKGWYIHPANFNGNSVVVLHGITDNREGVAGYGKMFLDRGYAVLLPDARDHGESGGDMATYGIGKPMTFTGGFPGCMTMILRHACMVLASRTALP